MKTSTEPRAAAWRTSDEAEGEEMGSLTGIRRRIDATSETELTDLVK